MCCQEGDGTLKLGRFEELLVKRLFTESTVQGLIKIGPLGLKGDRKEQLRKGSSYQNPEDEVERAPRQGLRHLSEGSSQPRVTGREEPGNKT